MTEITDLSTTDSSNTTVTGESIDGAIANMGRMDNTLQAILGLLARSIRTNVLRFLDNADPTKKVALDLSGLPTATERTWTAPYYSGTLGLVSDFRGYIFGITLTNDAGDLTNDIAFAAGSAVDSTGTASMLLASGLIKRLDAAWAAGTNQGGRFHTTLVDGQIYDYVIRNPTTGVVDCGFSDNASNPTAGASYPAGFTQYALVGKHARVSGTNVAPRSLSQETTDWVQYTPVFTGFGTPSGVSMWSRRVGDTLHVRGRFTTGTGTAVEGRMTLGFNGTSGNITSNSTKVTALQIAGPMIANLTSAISAYTVIESNVGSLAFSYQASGESAFTKKNGDGFGVGTAMSLTAEIPVAGW